MINIMKLRYPKSPWKAKHTVGVLNLKLYKSKQKGSLQDPTIKPYMDAFRGLQEYFVKIYRKKEFIKKKFFEIVYYIISMSFKNIFFMYEVKSRPKCNSIFVAKLCVLGENVIK